MTANDRMNELINAINNLSMEVREIGDILRRELPKLELTNSGEATYKSMVAMSEPDKVGPESTGGVIGCPDDYFQGAHNLCHGCREASEELCTQCWNQPYKGEALY